MPKRIPVPSNPREKKKAKPDNRTPIHFVFLCSSLSTKLIQPLLVTKDIELAKAHRSSVAKEVIRKEYENRELGDSNVKISTGFIDNMEPNSNWCRLILSDNEQNCEYEIAYVDTLADIPQKHNEGFSKFMRNTYFRLSGGNEYKGNDLHIALLDQFNLLLEEIVVRLEKPKCFKDIYYNHNNAASDVRNYDVMYFGFDENGITGVDRRKIQTQNITVEGYIVNRHEDSHNYMVVVSIKKDRNGQNQFKKRRKVIYCAYIKQERWDDPKKFYDLLENISLSNRIPIPRNLLENPLSRTSIGKLMEILYDNGIHVSVDILMSVE